MREMFRVSQKGFTFLELIAVLIVLAIMTAVAVSRLNNNDAEVVTGAATLKTVSYTHLRAHAPVLDHVCRLPLAPKHHSHPHPPHTHPEPII